MKARRFPLWAGLLLAALVLGGLAGLAFGLGLLAFSVAAAAVGVFGGARASAPMPVAEEAFMGGAMGVAPVPTMAPAMPQASIDKTSGNAALTTTGQEPPRLRQYFPEIMLWLPDAVTDEAGNLHLDVPVVLR